VVCLEDKEEGNRREAKENTVKSQWLLKNNWRKLASQAVSGAERGAKIGRLNQHFDMGRKRYFEEKKEGTG